jgi:hypothetical protein
MDKPDKEEDDDDDDDEEAEDKDDGFFRANRMDSSLRFFVAMIYGVNLEIKKQIQHLKKVSKCSLANLFHPQTLYQCEEGSCDSFCQNAAQFEELAIDWRFVVTMGYSCPLKSCKGWCEITELYESFPIDILNHPDGEVQLGDLLEEYAHTNANQWFYSHKQTISANNDPGSAARQLQCHTCGTNMDGVVERRHWYLSKIPKVGILQIMRHIDVPPQTRRAILDDLGCLMPRSLEHARTTETHATGNPNMSASASQRAQRNEHHPLKHPFYLDHRGRK